jgi:hypothetical protein
MEPSGLDGASGVVCFLYPQEDSWVDDLEDVDEALYAESSRISVSELRFTSDIIKYGTDPEAHKVLGLPRPLQRFDVANVQLRNSGLVRNFTLLLLDKAQDIPKLGSGSTVISTGSEPDLVMLVMREAWLIHDWEI